MDSIDGMANTSRRTPPGGIWIIAGVVLVCTLFGYVAYQAADAMLLALSSERSQDAAATLRLWLVFAALVAGVVFAALKFACQCFYGLLEVVVASVMAAELAKTAVDKEPFAALMGLIAIGYIVVRGIENASKGYLVLKEKKRRGQLLLGPLWEDSPASMPTPAPSTTPVPSTLPLTADQSSA